MKNSMQPQHTNRRVTGAKLAKVLDVHRSTVHRATQSGVLEKDADGLFNLPDSLHRWKLFQDGKAQCRTASASRMGLQCELLQQGIRRLEFSNEKKLASHISIDEVRRVCSQAVNELCRVLFAMPRENATVVGTMQPHEIEAHETKKLRAALSEISDSEWPDRNNQPQQRNSHAPNN